jgi:FSR family fosmidomycin resistance protein-like MFS transporter
VTADARAARAALVFSSLGHFLMHFFGAFYFVAVLALEGAWQRPYHELIELWTLGALLIGLAALPAGWLADRWSAPGMLAVMFLGMGAAAIAGGLSAEPAPLRVSLAALGLFAAIYHPVGIAWVVRTAAARGTALGINGVFGSLGVAAAGLVTGALIDLLGWRAAFLVPGALSLAAGVALVAVLRLGWVEGGDARGAAGEHEPPPGGRGRAFALLLVCMAGVGIMFQATQAALPKLFEDRLGALLGSGKTGVGAAVALVYLVAGTMQLVGGRLADRLPLKPLYAGGLLLAAPLQASLALLAGLPLLAAAALAAFVNAGVLPAENLLLARLAPARHASLAYGLKFVVAFGTAPLAVQLVAWIERSTGGVEPLFRLLALAALGAGVVALALPRSEPAPPTEALADRPVAPAA